MVSVDTMPWSREWCSSIPWEDQSKDTGRFPSRISFSLGWSESVGNRIQPDRERACQWMVEPTPGYFVLPMALRPFVPWIFQES